MLSSVKSLWEVKNECGEVPGTVEVNPFQQYVPSVYKDWFKVPLQLFPQEDILTQAIDMSGIVGQATVTVNEEPMAIPVKVQTAEEILRQVEAQVEAEVDLMMMSNEVPERKEEDDDEKVSSVAMKEEEERLGILNAAENDPDLALVRFTKRYNKNRHEPYVMRPEKRDDENYVAMRIENTRRAREWRDARRVMDDKRVQAILHLTKKVQRLEKIIEKFECLNKELLSNLMALETEAAAN